MSDVWVQKKADLIIKSHLERLKEDIVAGLEEAIKFGEEKKNAPKPDPRNLDAKQQKKKTRKVSPHEHPLDPPPISKSAPKGDAIVSTVIDDILAERQRQIEVEGWTPEEDDQQINGNLALVAACYAHPSPKTKPTHPPPDFTLVPIPEDWPKGWDGGLWSPRSRRFNLIHAAALIVAEVERLDRLTASGEEEEQD